MEEPKDILERRRLMAGSDPEKAASAAFELGVYYAERLDGLMEAEACFRLALAIGHPSVTPAVLVDLAGLLVRSGRSEDAERTYRAVLGLSDPTTQPLSAYGLGSLLTRQSGRERDAELALQQAADSSDSEYGPLAAYDLGTFLYSLADRFNDAVRALERAAGSGHPE